jgi:bilirubin oxidase
VRHIILTSILIFSVTIGLAQNPVIIPPVLSGTNFNLNIQSGTQSFYPGTNTPTYGINGPFLAPTLIVNKGDSITLNVTNNLNISTTIHWHGLHVAPQNDGGPHQIISPSTTWSPSFKVRNNAATYWYHPHGDGKTDLHVSKGIAGFLIVKDSAEAAITLPRTYGVDDFPLVVQTKAFDVLTQIAIATEDDTALFVNGTLNPYLNVPAQVVRLRLLNGSSMRTYLFGFSSNMSFKIIGGDGGLLDSSITADRIRMSPGERYEILVDLQGMTGQTFFLRNFGSELPIGIYGSSAVGIGADTIPYYSLNFRNGADYDVMQLNVTPPLPNGVTTIPTSLISDSSWNISTVNTTRTFHLNADSIDHRAEGPFNINGDKFDMDSIDETTYLNNVEIWKWVNNTLIAHPIHIHDMHFYILNINGNPPPVQESGRKDVVLVMPGDSVEFITRFETFANATVPYMYHCHLLHHEDDGMMGSLLVLDTLSSSIQIVKNASLYLKAYPNPSKEEWNITGTSRYPINSVTLFDITGRVVASLPEITNFNEVNLSINNSRLSKGIYVLQLQNGESVQSIRLIKN